MSMCEPAEMFTGKTMQPIQGRPVKLFLHKKVLLRERKRHTAHRVANTPYVVLSMGYPIPGWGVPRPWVPPPPVLTWPGGTPSQDRAYPSSGATPPVLTWLGGTPSQDGGTPQKGHGTSGSIIEWRWGTPPPPPVVDGHTSVKTLPSRIPLEMRAAKILF